MTTYQRGNSTQEDTHRQQRHRTEKFRNPRIQDGT